MPIVAYYFSPHLLPSLFFLLKKQNFFFLFRLKSLQAQEESRHRNSEQRSSEHRSSEKRGWEPRSSEQRKAEPRGLDENSADKRGADQRSADVIADYEKQLRTLKDEIAVLSAEKSVLQGRSDKFTQIFSFKFLLLVIKAWLRKGRKMTS